MSDYIKRKDAIEEINKTLNMFGRDHTITDYDAIDCILAVPSADVVEVVRCKDCKHFTYCENDCCLPENFVYTLQKKGRGSLIKK